MTKDSSSWLKKSWTRSTRQLSEFDWLLAGLVAMVGTVILLASPTSGKGYAIAATVALFIAFVAYPWQKGRDRANELRKEQRQEYRAFIPKWMAMQEMLTGIARNAGQNPRDDVARYGDVLRETDTLVFGMSLSSSPKVLEQLTTMHTAIYQAYRNFGLSMKAIYQKLPEGGSVPSEEIGRRLATAISEYRKLHRSQIEELLFRMRSEEFDSTGHIQIEDPELVLMEGLEALDR